VRARSLPLPLFRPIGSGSAAGWDVVGGAYWAAAAATAEGFDVVAGFGFGGELVDLLVVDGDAAGGWEAGVRQQVAAWPFAFLGKMKGRSSRLSGSP